MSEEFIGLHLAQHGIPSDVDYDVAEDYEFDPWRPAPVSEVVRITIPETYAEIVSNLLKPNHKGREMKHKLKATLAALATMAVLAAAMALPALASTGVDEAWDNDMNQETYWEARFGGECDKTENHSGTVDASQAVVKDGNYVRVYNPAPTQVLGPVNPANGNHFDPPHSWVITCRTVQVTTTSSTTTSSPNTTSTTVNSTTSTSSPGSSTTSSTTSTTSTSQATTTTQPTIPTELPRTGGWTTLLGVLAAGLLGLGSMILYLVKTQP